MTPGRRGRKAHNQNDVTRLFVVDAFGQWCPVLGLAGLIHDRN